MLGIVEVARARQNRSESGYGRTDRVCTLPTGHKALRLTNGGEPWAGAVCRLQGDVFSIDRLAVGKWIDSGYVGIGSGGD